MKIKNLHRWNLSPKEAAAVQLGLRRKVSLRGLVKNVRLVAGADVSWRRGDKHGFAAVVVLIYPELDPVETAVASAETQFPYIPGLLTFREGPLLVDAFRKIRNVPDVVICDGHGIAHQRQFGLACHIGVLLDLPTIGCAKTVLVGKWEEPAQHKGAWSPLRYQWWSLGRAVRTRSGVKPVFVSAGHKITLPRAVEIVLQTTTRYRLPQPARLAHHIVTQARVGKVGK